MTTDSNIPVIFVTYFSGDETRLCGEWLDTSVGIEKIQEHINGKLSNFGKGAFINVTDYDNFYGVGDWLGETILLEKVIKAADFIREEGQLGAKYIDFLDGNIDKAIETFQDAYAGRYEDLEDFVREINADKVIPPWLEDYINWQKMGEALILNSEILVVETGLSEVHVFWNYR
jgi:antirestriction protein